VNSDLEESNTEGESNKEEEDSPSSKSDDDANIAF
jgi:hypothetical protein